LSISVIDAHVAITEDGKWFGTSHDASLERLLDEMQAAAIERALLIAQPGAAENRFIAQVCERMPERFRGLGHIGDWSQALRELAEMESMGLAGLKVHPRSQGVDVLAPELEPFWRKVCEMGWPVMLDGYFQNQGNGLPLEKLTPFYYDKLSRAFPELRIILTHLGAQRCLDAFWVARSNPNFYLDLSHSLLYYRDTSLMKDFLFVMAMADQKVIYGSDFPEYGIDRYLSHVRQMAAQRDDIDLAAIFEGNLCKKLIDFN
jgi:predicted TIM-barrel fold metal-dependent hydrolase